MWHMVDKRTNSATEAVQDIVSGSSIADGGFGLVGIPTVLIEALRASGPNDLTIVYNKLAADVFALSSVLAEALITQSIASYIGYNKEYARRYLAGELTVEFTPQGTLAERMRAGGAGIPAFYTVAGVGTQVADGGLPMRYNSDGTVAQYSEPKETREF